MRIGLSANNVGRKLPYDREVKYLECNGGQWFDTGLTFRDVSLFDAEFSVEVQQTSTDKCICGLRNTTNNNSIKGPNFYHGSVELMYGTSGGGYYSFPFEIFTEVRLKYVADSNNSELFVDGILTLSNFFVGRVDNDISLTMFALNTGTYTTWMFIGKCEYYKITTENGLIFDVIPVVAIFDGTEEGCMYDRVSKRLFRNQGTGSFTWDELEDSQSVGGGEIDLTRIKLFHKRFSSEELVV